MFLCYHTNVGEIICHKLVINMNYRHDSHSIWAHSYLFFLSPGKGATPIPDDKKQLH